MKGLFISFEGGEGAGKTTQVKELSKWMTEKNIEHIITKEPGSERIKECMKIRKILLDPQNDLSHTSELLLFLADRAQHVEKLIRPTIDKGIHVICDRYSDSTRVYQSIRGIDRTKIDMLLKFATSDLTPDLTFLLDIPVYIGLERAKAKSIYKDGDRIEQAGVEFHENIRHEFLRLAKTKERFHVVNVAFRTIEENKNEIVEIVVGELWG